MGARYAIQCLAKPVHQSAACAPCMTDAHIRWLQGNTQVLRKPSLLTGQHDPGAAGNRGETPSGANDATAQRLQHDIIEGADLDTLYSPQSDIIRHIMGTVSFGDAKLLDCCHRVYGAVQ